MTRLDSFFSILISSLLLVSCHSASDDVVSKGVFERTKTDISVKKVEKPPTGSKKLIDQPIKENESPLASNSKPKKHPISINEIKKNLPKELPEIDGIASVDPKDFVHATWREKNKRLIEFINNPDDAKKHPKLYEFLRDDRLKHLIDTFKENPDWAIAIDKHVEKFGLSAYKPYIIAQIQQESLFKPDIISWRYQKAIDELPGTLEERVTKIDAPIGFMQIKPGTAEGMNQRHFLNPNSIYYDAKDTHKRLPFNYSDNFELGILYIREQLNRFGTLDLAFGAFNQGGGAVKRAGNNLPNKEAKIYVSIINNMADHIKRKYPNILEDAKNNSLTYSSIRFLELYEEENVY